jgi:hypothetical protein
MLLFVNGEHHNTIISRCFSSHACQIDVLNTFEEKLTQLGQVMAPVFKATQSLVVAQKSKMCDASFAKVWDVFLR